MCKKTSLICFESTKFKCSEPLATFSRFSRALTRLGLHYWSINLVKIQLSVGSAKYVFCDFESISAKVLCRLTLRSIVYLVLSIGRSLSMRRSRETLFCSTCLFLLLSRKSEYTPHRNLLVWENDLSVVAHTPKGRAEEPLQACFPDASGAKGEDSKSHGSFLSQVKCVPYYSM